jgi:two-component system nitrate/nitrite response regulator NarL
MAIERHIFLTERSRPLARWLEAFPKAEVCRPGALSLKQGDALIWLHLAADGFSVTDQVRSIVSAASGAPVVVLANSPGETQGLACLEAGAVGYVTALAAPGMLRQVVSVVENGGLWVGPELMLRLRTALSGQRPGYVTKDKLAGLSQREREVALAVAAGSSNKEIARIMGITERTVKAHLSAIFERLKINNRVQLSIMVNGERASQPEVIH